MKTTVEIADPLLRKARKIASREGVTLRALVERGLQRVVADAERSTPFKLRRVGFKGEGLRPELRDAPWESVRDLIYKDRGG